MKTTKVPSLLLDNFFGDIILNYEENAINVKCFLKHEEVPASVAESWNCSLVMINEQKPTNETYGLLNKLIGYLIEVDQNNILKFCKPFLSSSSCEMALDVLKNFESTISPQIEKITRIDALHQTINCELIDEKCIQLFLSNNIPKEAIDTGNHIHCIWINGEIGFTKNIMNKFLKSNAIKKPNVKAKVIFIINESFIEEFDFTFILSLENENGWFYDVQAKERIDKKNIILSRLIPEKNHWLSESNITLEILDETGNSIKKFNDGIPGVISFELPINSRGFKISLFSHEPNKDRIISKTIFDSFFQRISV